MKDKALYLIIGLLLGIVIMQWAQGPKPVQAQAQPTISGYHCSIISGGAASAPFTVMLENGDVYANASGGTPVNIGGYQYYTIVDTPVYLGNFWNGAPPLPTSNNTWGAIKGQYEKNK